MGSAKTIDKLSVAFALHQTGISWALPAMKPCEKDFWSHSISDKSNLHLFVKNFSHTDVSLLCSLTIVSRSCWSHLQWYRESVLQNYNCDCRCHYVCDTTCPCLYCLKRKVSILILAHKSWPLLEFPLSQHLFSIYLLFRSDFRVSIFCSLEYHLFKQQNVFPATADMGY